jgi:hypothetical protein
MADIKHDTNETAISVAGAALESSVRVSAEVLGIMGMLKRGIPTTPGQIAALRRHTAAITKFVNFVESVR